MTLASLEDLKEKLRGFCLPRSSCQEDGSDHKQTKLSIWKSPAHGQTKTHYILMTLEAVEQFKYLESLITTKNRLKL